MIGTFQDMFRDRPRCRTRIQHFMRASTYMRLAKDARGRISALSLFEYLMRKCFLLRLRIDLAREGECVARRRLPLIPAECQCYCQ